jgi:hypothetical protein
VLTCACSLAAGYRALHWRAYQVHRFELQCYYQPVDGLVMDRVGDFWHSELFGESFLVESKCNARCFLHDMVRMLLLVYIALDISIHTSALYHTISCVEPADMHVSLIPFPPLASSKLTDCAWKLRHLVNGGHWLHVDYGIDCHDADRRLHRGVELLWLESLRNCAKQSVCAKVTWG